MSVPHREETSFIVPKVVFMHIGTVECVLLVHYIWVGKDGDFCRCLRLTGIEIIEVTERPVLHEHFNTHTWQS